MDWSTVPHIGKADYPVLMPLLFDFVAVITKQWNDRAFGWIYVGLCASVLAIMRGMFADEVKRPALATLAIAFPTLNLWIGLAEAGVMAFGCAGLLFLRRGSITLGAVMLGLAAWSKNEGLALIGVSAIALFVTTRSIRKVLQLWPAVALIAPWMITRAVLNLSTDFTEGSMLKRVFERLGNPSEVIEAFVKAPPDQPWFWLAVLLAVLVFIRDAVRREAFLLIAADRLAEEDQHRDEHGEPEPRLIRRRLGEYAHDLGRIAQALEDARHHRLVREIGGELEHGARDHPRQ